MTCIHAITDNKVERRSAMDTAKWVTDTALPILKRRSVWIPIVAFVVVTALVWSMYAYMNSLDIGGAFSCHPQSAINTYIGSTKLLGPKSIWWRFLTITGVEYDNSYYKRTDAWVVPPGVAGGEGIYSEEFAVDYLKGIELLPAVGHRMQSPEAVVLIKIERYRPCTENLDNTEIPLGMGIRVRLLWIDRTILQHRRWTYNNIGAQ